MTYNRKRGMRTSGLLFLFWFFLALCGCVQYRVSINELMGYKEVCQVFMILQQLEYVYIFMKNIFYIEFFNFLKSHFYCILFYIIIVSYNVLQES